MRQVKDAIQHPFMFESILALTFANLAVISPSAHDIERSAWSHYSHAMSLLRSILAQGEIGDTVLVAIISMIGANYLQNNLAAFQVNLGGLRQVIKLRGGLQAIAHSNLIQSAILTVESFWTYLRAQTHLIPSASLPAISFETSSDTVSDTESIKWRMPLGFRDLFQQRRLSANVAVLIIQEAEYTRTLTFASPAAHIHGNSIRKFADLKTADREPVTVGSHIQTCEELARMLVNPNLTHLDYVCCTGMFINAFCVAKSEQLSPIYFEQLQHHARQLLDCNLDDNDSLSRDLHAWVIFQVASTLVPTRTTNPTNYRGDLRLPLALKVVKAYIDHTWVEMEMMLRNFICSEVCLRVFENVWTLGQSQLKLQI